MQKAQLSAFRLTVRDKDPNDESHLLGSLEHPNVGQER